MATLHIEHSVTDLPTWTAAFDRFAAARKSAGVRAHRVHRRMDDPNYLYIDLDFDTEAEAEAFLAFLRQNVWSAQASSPALIGTPQTRILEQVTGA